MINPFEHINWNPDKAAIRSFGKVVFIGLSIIGTAITVGSLYKGVPVKNGVYPLLICALSGLVLLLISLYCLKAARVLYVVWYAVGASIGIVVSNILLLLFFYLFFTTYAVIVRIVTSRDVLHLRLNEQTKSAWFDVNEPDHLGSYFNQY